MSRSIGFKDAARLLNRSESSVSANIKQLESQLGVPLFHRTTRSVELSAEGTDLLPCVLRAMSELQQGLDKLRGAQCASVDHIRISCSSTVFGMLISALERFQGKHPDISVDVTELSLHEMTGRILKGEFAFGVGAAFPFHEDLEFLPLFEEPLVAMIPKRFDESRLSAITLRDLCRLPLVLPASSSVTRNIFEKAVRDNGLTFDPVYEGMQFHTLLSVADSGLGAAILPVGRGGWSDYPDVRIVPIEAPALTRKLSIVKARNTAIHGTARPLVNLDGHMAAQTRRQGHGPFGPGLSIHQPGVADVPPPARP